MLTVWRVETKRGTVRSSHTFTRLFLQLEHPLRDLLNPKRLNLALCVKTLLPGEGGMVVITVSVVDLRFRRHSTIEGPGM